MGMTHKPRQYDLEECLIRFAVGVLDFVETLPKDYVGTHFSNQLTRSGTSPALNYGEAQAAESRRDFTHKKRIVLKELRETQVALKILRLRSMGDQDQLLGLLDAGSQLVVIFASSVKSTQISG
jgi:four helix bundle protein